MQKCFKHILCKFDCEIKEGKPVQLEPSENKIKTQSTNSIKCTNSNYFLYFS